MCPIAPGKGVRWRVLGAAFIRRATDVDAPSGTSDKRYGGLVDE